MSIMFCDILFVVVYVLFSLSIFLFFFLVVSACLVWLNISCHIRLVYFDHDITSKRI